MGDGSLSQDEIDALLMGADDMGGGGADPMAAMAAPAAPVGGGGFSPSEKEILADAFNEAMTGASSSVSSLVGRDVSISQAVVDEIDAAAAAGNVEGGGVVVDINMGSAKSALVFGAEQAKSISMMMMGAAEPPAELDDAHLSTLGELSNTLLGSLSNTLGGKFGENLNPSPPTTKVFNSAADWPAFPGDKVVRIAYNVTIDGNATKLTHFIASANATNWARNSTGGAAPADMGGGMDFGMGGGDAGGDPFAGLGGDVAPAAPAVPINPVNFPSLQQSSIPSQLPPNLELLLDVQMVLTVELGRTKKYVKDILSLGEGSIIELDKLAGEPVDLLINGKLIAKGEVVVIDENFGVRVTDIVGPAERLATMTGAM